MLGNTRIGRELEATEGIGNAGLFLVGILATFVFTSWLFSIGNILNGFTIPVIYLALGWNRFTGPYLGYELERWEEERDLD